MEEGAQDVYTDELFVGLTRPTTMWGVPYTAFVIEFMATTLIFLAVGNPLYLLLAAPIHGVLYAISASNPKAFDAIFMWLKTIGRCRNSRFSAVLQFLPMGDPEGIHARLSRWAGRNAPLGWLFDNVEDTLNVDDTPVLGFDVTEFLPNDETREPTMMYLFHRIETLLDGRRVPIFFDEFGQLSKDAAMRELVENKLVTIRKQDGFLIMGTQMPGQVIKSAIADAIIQQTATKIFLPNPEADHDEYVNGFKLTEREFQIIREFGEKSRLFLVKQGGNSVVAEFRLRGFDDELAVLSGSTATSNLVERLVAELGHDPARWLPEFHRIRKGGAERQPAVQVADLSQKSTV